MASTAAASKRKSQPELSLGNQHLDVALRAKELKIRHVAGLDTAANRFHLYCSNGYQYHIRIPDKDKLSPDERRHKLFDHALNAFSMLPNGTLILCEETISLKNGKTTRLLALAAGAIWAAHITYSVFWGWVAISTWKQQTVGKGAADKAAVAAWVQEHMGLTFAESEPDFYDAAAICHCGQQLLGLI